MPINLPVDAIALILKESLMKYGSCETRGQLANRQSIHDRPVKIEQRNRLGDLEIDMLVG